MITTRRGRAKKRRAEEEEPEADPTEALVRTTAALKDAHAAARNGHLDVVSLLVREHGASLTLCDRSGRCAWEVTPDAVHAEAVWLVEAGKSAVRASGATKLAAAPPKESSLMALVD